MSNTSINYSILSYVCLNITNNFVIKNDRSSLKGGYKLVYNLENINNGACNRVLSKHVTDTHVLLDNMLLICGDSGEKMLTPSFPNDDLNRFYTDIIMGEIDEFDIRNSKLRRFYGMGKTGFDTSSIQFSIHYFFKSEKNPIRPLREPWLA